MNYCKLDEKMVKMFCLDIEKIWDGTGWNRMMGQDGTPSVKPI